MKKYRVVICRPMYTSVVIEARDESLAEDIAFQTADEIPLSDFEAGEEYICEDYTQEIKEE